MSKLAIGIGCRAGAKTEAIVALVTAALVPYAGRRVAGLFTLDVKADMPEMRAAADMLRLRLVALARAQLATMPVATPSALVRKHAGIDSVAEAAALVGAGRHARLVQVKLKGDGVTCAIAAGEGR